MAYFEITKKAIEQDLKSSTEIHRFGDGEPAGGLRRVVSLRGADGEVIPPPHDNEVAKPDY